jgi:hypothetical protein
MVCAIDDLPIIAEPGPRRAIATTLGRFGAPAIRYARAAGIRVVALGPRARYDDASPTLRRLAVGVDAWPAPPAGLFVVEERAMYLRSTSPMTVAHEFGHALDCALGGGVYRSTSDAAVRAAFAAARRFITPYAASAIDEYFAEALRAWVGANDAASLWPQATRERLADVDPTMHAIVAATFAEMRGARDAVIDGAPPKP